METHIDNLDSKDSAQSSKQRISSKEKEELINFEIREHGLSKASLVIAFMIVALILAALVPKIYFANNIYYASRDISRLKAEKMLLDEEHQKLLKEIETINNKHLLLELGSR